MLTKLKHFLTPPPVADEDKTRVALIIHIILLTLLLISIVFPVSHLITGSDRAEVLNSFWISALLLPALLFLLWLTRRGALTLPGLLIPSLLLGLYTFFLSTSGIRDTAILGYAMVVIMAGLLLGKRAALIFLGLCLGAAAGLFWAETNGLITPTLSPRSGFDHLVSLIVNLSFTTLLFYVTLSSLSDSLQRARHDEAALAKSNRQLQAMQTSLEVRVETRTRGLEIIAALSERLSAILHLDDLLAEVVTQIQAHFGYYHVHIYLLDDRRETLVVAEGTGSAGAELKARGHRIPLAAPTSLVARAARSGQIVRVDDVRQAPDWLPNELLPNTCAELAVPIVLQESVVGVLDVQEDKPAALDEGDANLLRSLAGQVAVAIRNARYVAEVETALQEAREAQERYLGAAWDSARVRRQGQGRAQFSFDPATLPNESLIRAGRQQARTARQLAVVPLSLPEAAPVAANHQPRALVAPLRLGETTIGDLQLYPDDPQRLWTENELALITAVVDQLAQAAETLRLLNLTQERASREQLIAQIVDKLRRAPDMESLMQTGVSELARALGPARTFVRFGNPDQLAAAATPAPPPGNADSHPPLGEPEDAGPTP